MQTLLCLLPIRMKYMLINDAKHEQFISEVLHVDNVLLALAWLHIGIAITEWQPTDVY